MNEEIGISEFRRILLSETPVVDVRAPIEFVAGSIPGSVNFPLLNDEERHLVGTAYKQKGREDAIRLGHELVSGEIKEQRMHAWSQFLMRNPQAVITCFRGGLRSKTMQSWLAEAGYNHPRLKGGYKAFRQFLLAELDKMSARPMLVVSGNTGSGKTLLVRQAQQFRPTIDLEAIAKHRGSAFGAYDEPQPSQGDFENLMTLHLLQQFERMPTVPFIIEDESRMIGQRVLPENFFAALRSSAVIMIDEPLEIRVGVVYEDYILNLPDDLRAITFQRYIQSLKIISKKLGGMRYDEVMKDLMEAIAQTETTGTLDLHRVWIEKLLNWYYDPLYLRSLVKRNPKILFRGTRSEAREYLITQSSR